MKKISLIAFYTLTCFALRAQQMKEDIRNIQKVYNAISSYDAEMEVRVFETHKSVKETMVKKAVIKRNEQNYYYSFDGMDMLLNNSCQLLINNKQKQILYSSLNSTDIEKAKSKWSYIRDVDSMLKINDSVAYKGMQGKIKQYVIYNNRHTIQKIEIFMHAENYTIEKLVYYYNNNYLPVNNKVEVRFNVQNMSPFFETGFFSEKRFISEKGKRINPSKAYSDYKILIKPKDN